MLTALLAAAFDGWAVNVRETLAERRALLVRAAQRFFNRALVLAFGAWREAYVEAKEHKKRLYALAVRRFVSRHASAVFDAWIAFVEHKKFILKRAGYYLGDGLMMSHCFGSWKKHFI